MKSILNLKFIALALAMTAVIFAGCGEKTEIEPTITLIEGSFTGGNVTPGQVLTIKGIAKKGTDGKDLEMFSWGVSGSFTKPVVDATLTSADKEEYSFEFTWTVPSTGSGSQDGDVLNIDITATDKAGEKGTRTVTATVQGEAVIVAPKSFSNVGLKNTTPFFRTSGTGTSAISELEASSNASSVDITYYFSASTSHTIIQPQIRSTSSYSGTAAALTWGSVATTFRSISMTPSEFTALNDESLIKGHYDGGTAVTATNNPDGVRINSIAADQVFAFYNGTKYGVIHIGDAPSGDDGTTGIKVNIKVQN